MTAKEPIEGRLEKLGRAIGSDESLVARVMNKIDQKQFTEFKSPETSGLRRFIMNRFTKLAAAAVIIIAAVVSIVVLEKSASPAYAIEQTVDAMKNVRFLHVVSYDKGRQIKDQRWIELGVDGYQARYRQDTPPDFLVVQDDKMTAVYYKDKKTVVLYSRRDKEYQWIGPLGLFLENLRQKGKVLEENADYNGRPAHRVLWPAMNAECYVDPQTKLPIAIGSDHLSYEEPTDETFEITTPADYTVIDKGPGASIVNEPNWLKDIETADDYFDKAAYTLATGDYAKAAELFSLVVEKEPQLNWGWFWLGKAYYELGDYDSAIQVFSKVLEMMGSQPYAHFARGLAYARKGMMKEAEEDLGKTLSWMIQSLREPTAGAMFEYADDPRISYGEARPTEEQIVAKMVNRLRIVTGQKFGYDPNGTPEAKEQAIAAWENWFKTSGQIRFTPEAYLIDVTATPSALKELSNDPFLTGEVSDEEANAIEEFKTIRDRIEAGEKFEDNSTPLRLFLTVLSCVRSGDANALDRNCAVDMEKLGISLTSEGLSDFQYFIDLDVLRAPPAPKEPAEGQFWPIYVTIRSENQLADTIMPVFYHGKWMWVGNVGGDTDWRSTLSYFKQCLEKASK